MSEILVPDGVTGVLEGWWIESISKKECIFWGNIYHDKNKRFNDGDFIHTSGVLNNQFKGKPSEGDIIQTRNSTYQLGAPMRMRE